MRLERAGSRGFRQQALLVRELVVRRYEEWGLDGDVLAVVSALTVGDKSDLTPELKATYSASGASHVLALSGLHIGILAGILTLLLYPLRLFPLGRSLTGVLTVLLLWAFAFLSGLSASVVRAVTMFSLYVGASFFLEGRFSGFLSLSLAAFLMLLYRPFYLFDVSFQLSFLAVWGILLFYPVFSGWLPAGCRRIRWLWNTLSVSMAAQLGTLPFVLFYFGAFPTYFLLANLLVTPLAVCILGSSLAALAFERIPWMGERAADLVRLRRSIEWQYVPDSAAVRFAGNVCLYLRLSAGLVLSATGPAICLLDWKAETCPDFLPDCTERTAGYPDS